MTHALPTEYWLAPQALNITLNAMGDPNKTLGSTAAGAMVMCFVKSIDGVIGTYDNGHSYRRWTLQAYNTAFGDNTEKYVYIAIPRDATKTTALVVFPSVEIDIYGQSSDNTQVGSADYYYIYLHARISSTNGTTSRTWLNEDGTTATACTVNTGSLSTDAAVASAIATIDELLRGMFTPVKFVDNTPIPVTNLTDMQGIRANKHFFSVGGVDAYGYGADSEQGGSGGVSSFSALTEVTNASGAAANKVWGIISMSGTTPTYGWLTQQTGGSGKTYSANDSYISVNNTTDKIGLNFNTLKSALNIPDISGYGDIVTHNASEFLGSSALTGYATESWVNGKGYATESWVTGKGYATESFVTGKGYITSAAITGMLTTSNYGTTLNSVYAAKSHTHSQYLTSDDISDMLTKTDAATTYLGINDKAASASVSDKLTNGTYYAWGQQYINGGVPQTISGNISNAGDITFNANDARNIGSTTVGVRNIYAHYYTSPANTAIDITPCNSTGALVISTSNRVGIGIAIPDYKLHVNGDARFNDQIGIGMDPVSGKYFATPNAYIGNADEHTEMNAGSIELTADNPFIDFHGNKSSVDYTARLIASQSDPYAITVDAFTGHSPTLCIGNARLSYDYTNHMLTISDNSGQALNLVTTGGMTAYGLQTNAEIGALSNLNIINKVTSSIISTNNLWLQPDEDGEITIGDYNASGSYVDKININASEVSFSDDISASDVSASSVSASSVSASSVTIKATTSGKTSAVISNAYVSAYNGSTYLYLTINGTQRKIILS